MTPVFNDPVTAICAHLQSVKYHTFCTSKDCWSNEDVLDPDLVRTIATQFIQLWQEQGSHTFGRDDDRSRKLICSLVEKVDRNFGLAPKYAAATDAVFQYFKDKLNIEIKYGNYRVLSRETGRNEHSTFCSIFRNRDSHVSFLEWAFYPVIKDNKPFVPANEELWGTDLLNHKRRNGQGDCTLVFSGNHTFTAHMLILQQFSPFFEHFDALASSPMGEGKKKVFELNLVPDFDEESWEAFMTYVYTHKLDLTMCPVSVAINFLDLSFFFESTALRNLAFDTIRTREPAITTEDATLLKEISEKYPDYEPLTSLVDWLSKIGRPTKEVQPMDTGV